MRERKEEERVKERESERERGLCNVGRRPHENFGVSSDAERALHWDTAPAHNTSGQDQRRYRRERQ